MFGVVLWSLMILGALPESGQRELEGRLGWWQPRLMGLLSSFVEAFSGWQLLRSVLFRSELGVLSANWAIPLGIAGFYLLVEGILRLGVSLKTPGVGLPSLPVAIVYKAAIAFAQHRVDSR